MIEKTQLSAEFYLHYTLLSRLGWVVNSNINKCLINLCQQLCTVLELLIGGVLWLRERRGKR